MSKLWFPVFLMFLSGMGMTQSLQHPVIWVTMEDRPDILALIDNHAWAQSLRGKVEASVASSLSSHQANPSSFLSSIPALAQDDNLSEANASAGAKDHKVILSVAADAGMLYYLTEQEKYAQLAADVIAHYIDKLASRTPSTTSISGNDFYDPRTTYGHFAIAYDFVYNFLKKTDTKVYRLSTGGYTAFDHTKAQKAIKNIVGNALQEYGGADTYGKTISNHPVLTAPGALFSILCVEDDAERNRLFDVFWNKGTKHQNSFTKTILPMFGEQGVWPEALSYSFMPNIPLVLNVVDRIKPELNLPTSQREVLEGCFLFDYLRNPDRRFVRYGDSKRNNDATADLYRHVLHLANRNGLTDLENSAKVALKQAYDADGGYKPQVSSSTFDNYDSYSQLLWGVPIPETLEGQINFNKPTVIVKHAGVALQRNNVEVNNKDYGLTGIIGGAHYVHSHATGIAMELYGAGYVMAPNGGLAATLADRKSPEHTGYFWRHAGNNTMIVNGTTHGIQKGAWNSNSDLWMNTTVNIAAEPAHLEEPSNENFSFATQFLNDEVNNCQQQRTLSTIRTSETTGYYFDMFRSKSLGANNFHDYLYHNIGDNTSIMNVEGQELSVSSTTRYQTDIGDTYKSPGWWFFENTQATSATGGATNVRFDINYDSRAMHVFIPGGVSREYTKAVGPASREAKNGYVNKKTQILAIRQYGEAWTKPYVVIFEPTIGQESSVQSVEHLYSGSAIVGAKVTSKVGEKEIVDYVICNEDEAGTFSIQDIGLEFNGRFAVARLITIGANTDTILYKGQGSSLVFGGTDAGAPLTSAGDSDFEKLVLCPQPSKGVLNLDLQRSVDAVYRLYTLSGNLLMKGTFHSKTHLDLSGFDNGMYLVEVMTADHTRVAQKVIIQK